MTDVARTTGGVFGALVSVGIGYFVMYHVVKYACKNALKEQ